jgi:hypothetical protein
MSRIQLRGGVLNRIGMGFQTLGPVTNDILMSNASEHGLYGDIGGIINPDARSIRRSALESTTLPLISSNPTAAVPSPQARLDINENPKLGIPTNGATIIIIAAGVALAFMIIHKI